MKKYLYVGTLIILLLLSTACNNKKEDVALSGKPKIVHLRDTYSDKYFVFENFQDNIEIIKNLFNHIDNFEGNFVIVTNIDAVSFEDNDAVFKYDKTEIFSFKKKNKGFKFISLKPIIKLKEQVFYKKTFANRIEFYGIFDDINIDILQNFINDSCDEEQQDKYENSIYELYNKDKVKKAVLTFHNYGEWFSIDIL